jgi:hypothetical protein
VLEGATQPSNHDWCSSTAASLLVYESRDRMHVTTSAMGIVKKEREIKMGLFYFIDMAFFHVFKCTVVIFLHHVSVQIFQFKFKAAH